MSKHRKFFRAVALGAIVFASVQASTTAAPMRPGSDGLHRVRSVYGIDETVARLRRDVADKGIMFFALIDQSTLAAEAGIQLRPSKLLVFGNPGLGAQFLTSNPLSGIDWPVRLLVVEDARGDVWAVYTDFARIAERHGITDRDEAFAMASRVIASITASVQTPEPSSSAK